MIKVSRVEAYQSFDENDFSVMDDETFLCFNSDQRGDREQTQQFFINEANIFLEIYWDGEKVHTVSFKNRLGLSELGKGRLTEVRQIKKKDNEVFQDKKSLFSSN